ncbi:unnamed protein product [Zymoseptoria tritici ST99CH_1E4]|uniref:Nucleolar 27S pre-rRNA processing Urb2/Npa2 C-terminal domain-containing protein n=1 Tax=Zymoseptoria tritici ST99CH_1E4 TaxID=1276532 RepID=A0A2H1FLY8_ZYMTR|nr:unnamed protein product [Zymoseptoria tritici ST99CH_1E4]
MVGSGMDDRPSLDRLKALDSLPNLESQFAEAKSICSHNARAEMILRWLMGKFKSSTETCRETKAWDVLASTIRLTSPQKIALFLYQLPGVLQDTFSAQELSQALLYSVTELLNLLLELGRGPDGAAIKALLSMESSAAALLCGNWLRHVHTHSHGIRETQHLIARSLLDPALQIWELRKRQDSDDMNFNTHCLVSVLPLLEVLEGGDETGSKRRRGESLPGSARSCERALESLVAKHTILPARSAFFRKTDPQARRLQHGLNQATIGEALASLKNSLQDEANQDLLSSVPKVLDIALRSSSTPTPRHRTKERPWIESVLSAVRDAFHGRTEEEQSLALTELLRAVRVNKATLSAETLARIVRDNIASATSSKTAVNWKLVEGVVELDANVLLNPKSTNEVFDEITKEAAFDGSEDGTYRSFMESRWRDGVILPTMRAHAQSRTLSVFTDCWFKQLQAMQSIRGWSVWDSVGDALAETLENSLSGDTILELLDRYSTIIQQTTDSQANLKESEKSTQLRAALCVLGSLLRGIRSDALISSIQLRLDILLGTVLGIAELKGFKTTIASDCHYWRSLTRVFELWYPHWASKQADRQSVTSMGASLLSNKAFKSALSQFDMEDSELTLGDQARLRHSAQTYVATLCQCFGQYGGEAGCAGLCTKAIERVAEQKASAADALVRFPSLLATVQSDLRKGVMEALFQAAAVRASIDNDSATQLQAVLHSFQGLNKTAILEEFATVAIQELKTASKSTSARYEAVFTSTMANIDAASLDQTQRTNILDTVLGLPPPKQDQAGILQLRDRLALVLKLASLPCQDSRLLTDATALWDIVGMLEHGITPDAQDESRLDLLDSIRLLEEISKRALRSWLGTQDREKSRELLLQMSKRIKDRVKTEKKAGKLSAGRAGLALVKVAIAMIENGAREATKETLVHREAKIARAYVDMLAADVEAFSSSARNDLADLSDLDISNCASVLAALLELPDTFLIAAGMEPPEHAKRVSIALNHVRPLSMESIHRSRLAVTVFRLEAKYMLNKELLSATAIGIIESEQPSAKEQADVLATYEQSFAKFDVDLKLQVAFDVLTMPPCLKSFGFLLLARAAIRGLTKEDFDNSSRLPTTLLHRNLQAASQDKGFFLADIKPGDELLVRRAALQNLAIIFKEKPFMVNQYGIEQTLHTLQSLLTTCQFAGALYLDMTQVLNALFLHHSSRLRGRFHLVISLLQSLLTHLFRATTLSSPTPVELSIRQARALARLLESFSNPPPLRHHRGKASDLVDESRKAQAHAGQFTQYLLHHYCAQVLTGSLGEGAREALLPGLWAVIEAMEVYSSDAIKSLSAAVNNSERAVLRSVYDDWKRFGKWEGL